MAKPLIVANWKSNPDSLREAAALAKKIEAGVSKMRGIEVIIAPPFPFLESVGRILKKTKLGAQNVFWKEGPYTGEVSPSELKSLGVASVIIGHSERKINLGETDEIINKKVKAALAHGFLAVLCVGEKEREKNEIPIVVGEQLKNALRGVPKNKLKNLAVAYEPVWAISTSKLSCPDTPENAFRARIYLKRILAGIYGTQSSQKVKIIYGGSVNPANIAPFLRDGKMEGALVGGASLKSGDFIKIVESAAGI